MDVLGLRARPVVVAVLHTDAPEPESVQVPLPMFKVRVLLLLETKESVVTLKFAAVNVPEVRDKLPAEERASASVTVVPEPEIWMSLSVLPLLVIVPEA